MIAPAGGSGTLTVNADQHCAWTVTNVPSFVTLSAGSGVGRATLTFSVDANPGNTKREAMLDFRGELAYLRQAATPLGNSTFFSYQSDAGEYVGRGLTYAYVLSDGSWSASADGGSSQTNHVSITISVGSLAGGLWMLNFAAPNLGPLVPGTYENAIPWISVGSPSPGMGISGDGRGCGVSGRFVVLEADYGANGTINRFHATFEQHCEGASPALNGEILIVGNPWR